MVARFPEKDVANDQSKNAKRSEPEQGALPTLLTYLGVAAIVVSVLGGLALISQANSLSGKDDGPLGWVVLIGGTVQGLMLMAFGNALQSLALTAIASMETAIASVKIATQTAKTVSLLEEAVRPRDE